MREDIKHFTRKAGELAAQKFGNHGQVTFKDGNPMDPVSEGDTEVNELLVELIKAKYPKHGIISEELAEHQIDSEHVWVIDPIDGTNNFVNRVPCYAVLVTLMKNNVALMACIYDPVHNTMYFAERGAGAYKNGKRIYRSKRTTVANSFGLTNDRISKGRIELLTKISNHLPTANVQGSSIGCTGIACAYVAEGIKDWYVCSGSGKIWDYAGPVLIMQEAGCKVTDFNGDDWKLDCGPFIAANPQIHAELLSILK